MSDKEGYAQKLANLTGREICCVEVKQTGRVNESATFPLTSEQLEKEMVNFFDSLGEIKYIYPQGKTP